MKHRLLKPAALLAAGVLGSACGSGEIGAGGDQSDMFNGDARTASPVDAADSGPSVGSQTPYGHVVPADVGVTLGVGVVAAVPTEVYSGPTSITADDTTIENVIINGCLYIRADNFTLRNVIMDCAGYWGIDIRFGDTALFEYNKLRSPGGQLMISENYPNQVWRNNEIYNATDFFYPQGDCEGYVIEDNWFHDLTESGVHSDGMQIGESPPPWSWGHVIIRGNYWDPQNQNPGGWPADKTGMNDLLFATSGSSNTFLIENNFVWVWGYDTFQCRYGDAACTIKNNVYAQAFKTRLPAFGRPQTAAAMTTPGPHVFECNRYEDGDLIEQQYVGGDNVTYINTGCPSYP